MAIQATFDSTDIQDANIILTEMSYDTIPPQELKRYRIIRGDGEVITDKRFGAKKIDLLGRITGSSQSDLETRLDGLRSALFGYGKENKLLVIDYTGGSRQWVATAIDVQVDRVHGSVNFANIKLSFISTTPFGSDTSSSSLLSSTAQTTSPNSKAITVGGTAPDQKLVITVELNSFTGASVNTITLKNNDTGYALSVSRAWTASDTLVVDVANLSVKVNGTEVDYSGAFPDFAPGSRTLVYSDDFTARNVDLTVTNLTRYL